MTFDIFEFFSVNTVCSGAHTLESLSVQRQPARYYPEFCRLLAADRPENYVISNHARQGKFIQLMLHDHVGLENGKNGLDSQDGLTSVWKPENHEMMIFMPFDKHCQWYHAAILRELLNRLQVAGGYPEKFSHLDNYAYCTYDSNFIQVIGGGYYDADPEGLLLRLYGNSSAFGRFDKQNLRAKIDACRHPFAEYQLMID